MSNSHNPSITYRVAATDTVIRKPVPVARIGRNTSRIYCERCGRKRNVCTCPVCSS